MSEMGVSHTRFVKPILNTNSQDLPRRSGAATMQPLLQVFENLPMPIDAFTHAYYLVTKRQLAQQLALSGRQRVLETFTRETQAAAMVRVYQQVVNR